jgi:outer membrane protein OmpA-like peptidoglycan-associated protein
MLMVIMRIDTSYIAMPLRDGYHRYQTALKMAGLIVLGLFAGLVICPGWATASPARPFDSVDAAARSMTTRLLNKARMDLGAASTDIRRVIAVDLFIDSGTGEVPVAGLEIERVITAEARLRFTEFGVVRLTSKTVAKTDYWIGGTITRTISEGWGPCFRIEGSLRDVWNGSEVSRAEVLVLAAKLDATPMAIYKDSPFYDLAVFKARRDDAHQAGANYGGVTFGTRALLMDAARAYEKADFMAAQTFLKKAVTPSGAGAVFIYNGLYLVNQQLGQSQAAARAMQNAIAVSIKKYGTLMVRLAFEKNSAEFPAETSIRDTYIEWLGHIAAYFRNTQDCLRIIGHTSRTGSESWNALLSKRRARFIQKKFKVMLPDVMARSEAVGIGSRKTLVGIGTDDNRDAVDRRVEIIILDCKKLPTR